MSATLRIVGAEPTLEELAATANLEHRCAIRSAQDVLEHARLAGEALLAAKQACGHGKFMSWVSTNCQFSHSTACNYMAIAGNRDKIPTAGNLTAALAEIALTKVVRPSTSDLDDDALKADARQMWLFPEEELPLQPRDPAQHRDALAREDRHDFRCPRCAREWDGDPRPPLRGGLAQLPRGWKPKPLRAKPKFAATPAARPS